ncbi:ABC transporter ATP-binding protein [Agrobacterium rosae]|uniref:ABC transporter ATP-binding protein n=1 Tax=Agrobacterium rosae TaxID=1972867 RepID=A0AAW9FMM1_9HYPH|nr:ABC transporter ATP-binding protein [Agrobacterium rosae]MDX8305817.1 ABC transporter ATP-binding protein [Agrobacterium rosae]
MDEADLVSIQNVSKMFDSFVAIRDASINFRAGEVHALVGENGAGKSTLMNILYGLLSPTKGRVMVRGQEKFFSSPSDAIGVGIGMVHQHFKLAPSFTVAENIILGSEPTLSFSRLDMRNALAETGEMSKKFGLELDPAAIVGTLPVGLRQRVEILKALYRRADILILDEPTAVLTPLETEQLFATMRSLAANGCAVIFITHKLREVLAVSDKISVMRQGKILATLPNKDLTPEKIASLMVGRNVMLKVEKKPAGHLGDALLDVIDLNAKGNRGALSVKGVSLSVHRGEIVGIAGVQGNGQDELIECIAGIRRPIGGAIRISGTKPAANPAASRDAGLAYVPADRAHVGLSLKSPIWENLLVGHTREFGRAGFFSAALARQAAARLIAKFDVRGAGMDTSAGALSGGNQQKVQLARELTRDADLIVVEQPSQGVDVGAIEAIHKLLVEMRDAGKAVLIISADLDEIFGLSDRILVMYDGMVVGDLVASETSIDEVGMLMGGISSPPLTPKPNIQGVAL